MTERGAPTERPLLVIFGAGATFDSIRILARRDNVPDRPPLAQELFAERYDNIVNAHAACGALVAYLRSLPPTVNLEMELDRLQIEEAPKSALRRRQLIALRYYLRDVLRGAADFEHHAPGQTNYHLLIEQLVLWQEVTGNRVTLVTFNYDTMLERAVSQVTGRRIVVLDDYMADETLRIFKLHGSVDWSRLTDNARDPARGGYAQDVEEAVLEFAAAGTLSMSNSFVKIDTAVTALSNEKLLVPAITIPVRQKGTFEVPDEHQAFLATALSSGSGVLKVLTIGWRGGERHFLDFWLKHRGPSQPQLLAVSGTESGSIATIGAIRSAGIGLVGVRALDGGFSHVIGDPLREFLDARLGDYRYDVH